MCCCVGMEYWPFEVKRKTVFAVEPVARARVTVAVEPPSRTRVLFRPFPRITTVSATYNP